MKAALVIDTSLLVLFVVGAASPTLIAKHKRLSAFTQKDYEELCELVARASSVLVTPNTLTETSNLAAQIAEPDRSKVMAALSAVIAASTEQHVPSKAAAARPEFVRLGLTDTALLEVANDDMVLLTADAGLYLAAIKSKREAINFNHLRERWL